MEQVHFLQACNSMRLYFEGKFPNAAEYGFKTRPMKMDSVTALKYGMLYKVITRAGANPLCFAYVARNCYQPSKTGPTERKALIQEAIELKRALTGFSAPPAESSDPVQTALRAVATNQVESTSAILREKRQTDFYWEEHWRIYNLHLAALLKIQEQL